MTLSSAVIRERLDEIFVQGTADANQIDAAKYRLRISGKNLTAPDGTRYGAGLDKEELKGAFDLRPGQVAFLSTRERFHMPVDLAGYLSARYREMRKGFLILHGSIVDPAFGAADPEGEPIQFYVINIGDRTRTVEVGETGHSLIAVAFDELSGLTEAAEPISVRRGTEQASQLHGIQGLRELWTIRGEFRFLEARVRDVVIFGFFLLGTASLGAVAAVLVPALTSAKLDKLIKATHWPAASLGLGFLLFVYLTLRIVVRAYDQRQRVRRSAGHWEDVDALFGRRAPSLDDD
jgi:deoxycytidine triphosphate deaminase